MISTWRIGIVAPSSVVSPIELDMGVEKLRHEGFDVTVHPQCKKKHLFFAGTDQERAQGFFQFAQNPDLDVIWCARGGYGAIRILPLIEAMVKTKGPPKKKKLLVGLSDSTVLMEYVRTSWGWSILYAPMPGLRKFCHLTAKECRALVSWIRQESAAASSWKNLRLKFVGNKPHRPIHGTLVGGNLSLWSSVAGTRFAKKRGPEILFFEDVSEGLYRIDRMLQQILLSGGFEDTKAIILGNFLDCNDTVSSVLRHKTSGMGLKKILKASDLVPIRKKLDGKKWIPLLFKEAVRGYQIPVAFGLPSGHGPGQLPLPLGAEYELSPTGRFELVSWDWVRT